GSPSNGIGHRPRAKVGPPALLDDREGDVAAITEYVNEVRLGKESLDDFHVEDVTRCLIAPPALAKAFGIKAVKRAQGLTEEERDYGVQALFERPSRDVEVLAVQVGRERLFKRLPGVRGGITVARSQRNELRLRWDCQLGMRIEHQPEQRRSRTVLTNY